MLLQRAKIIYLVYFREFLLQIRETMNHKLNFFFASLASICLLGLYQCAPEETVQKTFKMDGISVVASGPLFSGSNTAQGNCTPDLNGWMKKEGLESNQIRTAQLISATVHLPDTGFNASLETLSLLFAGEKLDMQTLGVLNPVPADQSSLQVSVAETQEQMDAWLKQPEFTVVLDSGLVDDSENDLELTVDLAFSIIVSK